MKNYSYKYLLFIVFFLSWFWSISGNAEDKPLTLTISNHQFSPNVLEVPAGAKIKLVVKNLDPTPEEFESYDLNREKVVPGGGEIIVLIGPLKPGTYAFFGEFHKDTAKGQIVAK